MTTSRDDPASLPKPARRLKQLIKQALGQGDRWGALPLLREFIDMTEQASESDEELSELRAAAQQALGDVLTQLDTGPDQAAAALREAIEVYEAALEVYTRDAYPVEYAMVHNNLGNAYRELPSATAEDHELNLGRATAAYETALTVRTRDTDPYGWARTQNNLGNAHAEHRQGDVAEHRRRAIAAFRAALEVHDAARYPDDYAMDLTNLGLTYAEPVGGVQGHDLDEAMVCFLRALLVHTVDSAPHLHRRLVLSLADAFVTRMELTPTPMRGEVVAALGPVVEVLAETQLVLDPDRLDEAEVGEADVESILPDPSLFDDYFDDLYRLMPLPQLMDMVGSPEAADDPALRVVLLRAAVDRDDVVLPSFRATLLNGLALALLDLRSGDVAAFQEEAIDALEEALDASPRVEDPERWGTIQNHLGAAYGQRILGDRAENAELALQHAVAAVDSRAEGSPEWATMMVQLGQLHRDRRLGAPRENCDQALTCFDAALRVWTREDHPYEWARTKNSAGLTLVRTRPDDAEALEHAIGLYKEALTVITQDGHPFEWSGVESNLASALVYRDEGDEGEDVERAIRGHTAILSVRTQDRYPTEWAETQHNLGQAYFKRRAGERNANLAQAVAHFQAALEVFTLVDRPAHHRTTAGTLGNAEAERGRWDAAHEAFASSAAAGNLLLGRITTGPYGFDDVVRQGHEVGELDAFALVRLGRLEEAVLAVEQGRTRWIAESLDETGDIRSDLTLREMADGIGQPFAYVVPTPWGGLALVVRPTEGQPEVVSCPLPDLTDTIVRGLVQQNLPDSSRRLLGGFAAAQEGTGLHWLVHQWPGESFAEKAAQLHAACGAADVEGSLDLAAQAVLALESPGLADIVDSPVDTLGDDELSRLATTFDHALLQAELPRCLRGLADVITKPLGAVLVAHGIDSLVLIPCGLLPGFPLTAAPIDGVATVADRLQVSVAPSVWSLLESRDSGGGEGREGVYTLGDPRPTHQQLPWGEAEALTVAKLAGYPGRARVHEAATRAWLTESLCQGRVVATSCHGAFEGRDVLRSRLLLAGGEDLTLAEILAAPDGIAGLRALVVSACQTAVMDLRGAHGEVRSLAAGILRAGAQAVVAPLWAVDDRATYLLMVRFAQEWLPVMDEQGPARALARAQAWMRTVSNQELANWEVRGGLPAAQAEPASDHEAVSAVRGRGSRYTAGEAEQLTAGLARRRAADGDDVPPYADPVFWAGFVVHGL